MPPAANAAAFATAAAQPGFDAPLLAFAATLAAFLAALWICAVATVWHRQDSLIFRPDPRPLGAVPTSLAEARFRSERVSTADGLGLSFWAAEPLPGWPTLVVFHGRAGNAADRAPLLLPFAEAGYGVVLAEYRGYGGNPGAPSEAGFLLDARAHLDWLAATWGEAAPVVCGESIGSGVAVMVAAERPVRALVLDAPYTSVADLAAAMYRWLPARRLLRHHFDSISRLPTVRAPVLVLHGDADRLIPHEHGRRVAAAAGGRAEFVLLRGAGHPALADDPAGRGMDAVERFLADLAVRRAG
ncbi:alpha/beta hydrolase [Craurococcus roseus]|uniref:Alpha/beta hydrolase n=1 Tax=Craurococcus roseus TaxID=77585 RepID=A0ABN1FAV7_9PROT